MEEEDEEEDEEEEEEEEKEEEEVEMLRFVKISNQKDRVFRHSKKKPIKRLGFLIEASLKYCKTR